MRTLSVDVFSDTPDTDRHNKQRTGAVVLAGCSLFCYCCFTCLACPCSLLFSLRHVLTHTQMSEVSLTQSKQLTLCSVYSQMVVMNAWTVGFLFTLAMVAQHAPSPASVLTLGGDFGLGEEVVFGGEMAAVPTLTWTQFFLSQLALQLRALNLPRPLTVALEQPIDAFVYFLAFWAMAERLPGWVWGLVFYCCYFSYKQ